MITSNCSAIERIYPKKGCVQVVLMPIQTDVAGHRTDLPEKRVCAGGVAPCAHPFFGNFSVWLSSYDYKIKPPSVVRLRRTGRHYTMLIRKREVPMSTLPGFWRLSRGHSSPSRSPGRYGCALYAGTHPHRPAVKKGKDR